MRKGKPSRTAQFVALHRALGTLAPQVPGFTDPFASHFLPDKWQRKVEQARGSLQAALARRRILSGSAAWAFSISSER